MLGVAALTMTGGVVFMAMVEAGLIWLAVIAVGFFGLGGLFLLLRALDRAPVVTINSAGVFDRRLMRGPIPWSAIVAIGFPYAGPLQCLQLAGEGIERYAKPRHPWLNRMARWSVGEDSLLIPFHGLDGDLTQALAAIHAFQPQIKVLGVEDEAPVPQAPPS
jgi:hypothetical protein